MNVRSFQSPWHRSRCALLALAVALLSVCQTVRADEFPTTCNYDEQCGWVDQLAEQSEPLSPSVWDTTVTAVAMAVANQTDCYVQGLVEPLALIPIDRDLLAELRQSWQSWACLAEMMSAQPIAVDTSAAIEEIAALEPIDVESLGPSVLVRDGDAFAESDHLDQLHVVQTGTTVSPIDPLIGGAPMIVTIDEPYLPYDLTAADLRLRSVFPITTEPFCVRSRAAGWNPVPMWVEASKPELKAKAKIRDSADHVVARPTDWPVDCLLDQVIRTWNHWRDQPPEIVRRAQPAMIGQQLASLVASGEQLAIDTTMAIAMVWRQPPPSPSQSGRALLTRAEATIQDDSVGDQPPRIADAPPAAIVR